MPESDELARFYRQVDDLAAHLREAHAARLKCGRGCSSCCADDLNVYQIEAENIRAQYPSVLMETPHPAGVCAFLDDAGACRIYASRPYVCRTQGLPLRWLEETDEETFVELRDICPLNEAGEPIEELPEETCWTIGPFEQTLAQLQYAQDKTMPRVALRDLFANS
jgi:Fe-S-cluster containining protein